MWRPLGVTLAVAVPAILVWLTGTALSPELTVLLFGAGVVASAVLLSWAAEAAQVDISGSLAIAILALIAVLPEYAVDLYFSYTGGGDPSYVQYAAANMTGSNRLLIGIGWPLVAFVAFWAMRRRRGDGPAEDDEAAPADGDAGRPSPSPLVAARGRIPAVVLPTHSRVELAFLAIASAYAFVIPFTRSIAWYDAVVLLALFVAYIWRVTREGRGEPELIGVAADIARLPRRSRRLLVTSMFLAAAAIVVMAAKPFADGLVATGANLGIDQFLLVQWLAPLSSEAPELIVATIFAWRLHAADGLGMLLSAKVNQWTLLVGSLWVAYSLGGGGGAPLPLDDRQTEEFLLTSAQALLAFAVLADRRFGLWEAVAIFGLFVVQFPFPTTDVRLVFSAVYIAVALGMLVHRRRYLPGIVASIGRWDAGARRRTRRADDSSALDRRTIVTAMHDPGAAPPGRRGGQRRGRGFAVGLAVVAVMALLGVAVAIGPARGTPAASPGPGGAGTGGATPTEVAGLGAVAVGGALAGGAAGSVATGVVAPPGGTAAGSPAASPDGSPAGRRRPRTIGRTGRSHGSARRRERVRQLQGHDHHPTRARGATCGGDPPHPLRCRG